MLRSYCCFSLFRKTSANILSQFSISLSLPLFISSVYQFSFLVFISSHFILKNLLWNNLLNSPELHLKRSAAQKQKPTKFIMHFKIEKQGIFQVWTYFIAFHFIACTIHIFPSFIFIFTLSIYLDLLIFDRPSEVLCCIKWFSFPFKNKIPL